MNNSGTQCNNNNVYGLTTPVRHASLIEAHVLTSGAVKSNTYTQTHAYIYRGYIYNYLNHG